MRLCVRAGAWCLLPVLVLLTVPGVQARERHYYIAAVEIDWNYSGNATNRFSPTYKKVVFREYEKDFRQAKTHPSWLGLLGPTLRAEEGETIVVTFRNMATGPHSIHPHGVSYGKQSEGAHYFDNTSQKEKEDDVVHPNHEHVYYWEVTPDVSPQPDDPTCLTHTYISHQNVVQDYNSGLIGALLICKPGSLDESGVQIGVHQEYVFLFGVFDERESKYQPRTHANHVKYTINGYAEGSLPDVSMCAYSSVSLHLVGMSSEPEVFSVHMNGQVLEQTGHKMSSVGLISGSSTTASMTPLHRGRWMLSSHTIKHMEAGTYGFVDVKKCAGFKEPRRQMTIQQKKHSREWKYYIAAEEIVWDYAPNRDHIDENFKLQYLKQSSKRIGGKYKKAVYTMYSNESFTERSEDRQRKNELGILGPVIRAQIRDVIKIVFKNMASRPYSIYPHGLSIEKSEEGVNYPAGGNQSHGVQPGETRTYVWRVLEEDEPLDGDSRCLTRMYHSAVDTPRDIASGLIGPILICKTESLNVRNVQLKADKEQHAMFAVFDENKSWYVDDNIRQYCDRSQVNKADPDFYKSNVMHTINGYVFESGPLLGFCNGEVATWHISSIGAQDYIQTATFYGHPFGLNERTEDFLSLYPMTGETITMNMDNIGVWLLASLNSHETTKGMRVKFQDVECFRDYQYEYEDYGDSVGNKEFTVWNPASLDDIKEKEQKPKPAPAAVEIDDLTALYAQELGLRSLKNQSSTSDVDQLDLSFLEYDDTSKSHRDTKSKSENSTLKQKTQNETLFWEDVDASNLTAVNVVNQSVTDNTTHVQDSSMSSAIDNSFVYEIENITVDSLTTNSSTPVVGSDLGNVEVSDTKSTTVTTLENVGNASTDANNVTTLSKVSNASTDANNVTTLSKVSNASTDSNNVTTLSKVGNVSIDSNNVTTLSKVGNVSIDNINLTVSLEETTNLTVTISGNSSSILETGRMNETLTDDNLTSVDFTLSEGSEERPTRGDVFSYSVPINNSSNLQNTTQVNATSLSNSTQKEVENNTANVNASADGTNHSLPVSAAVVEEIYSSMDSLTIIELELESTDNKTTNNESAAELGYELQINSSETVTIPANSSLENVTEIMLEIGPVQNITVNISGLNSSGELSSDSRENATALLVESNHTSSAESEPVSGSLSNSEELIASYSIEEFFIYLKENNTEGIKTTSVKTQEHNWTYDGTHQTEPMEIPDYMMKYFEKETPRTSPAPKKRIKKVNLRQWPQKGHSMKTKKRKEYKPQAKSGLPFSPRGFNPAMTPRGSRPNALQPISDEENLINMPVVIGVPRPDFSDYELYVPGEEPQHLDLNGQDVKANEYEYVSYKDPYSSHEDIKNFNLDETTKYYFKYSGPNTRTYFIAAEEVEWDYAGYGQRREEKSQLNSRVTKFTKVVFRSYMDSSFSTPDIRGEIDEHLGILGPVIKAEVGQSIMRLWAEASKLILAQRLKAEENYYPKVVFRNNANRPYSLHPNGVTYTKQTEGLSYEDGSKYWYKYDNEVQPNITFTYIWKASSMVGPMPDESHCRTWAYYSGVNPERDIHSGLIGPLLVCREGTLSRDLPDMREFTLLFMTFDESRSWYFEKNSETMQRKNRRRLMDPNLKEDLKFHSINGIIYNLKGLRMYTNQLVCWHLINMGSPYDFQSLHFHGQTFLHKKMKSYRQSVFPLLPGSFATLEMYPSKPGLWQLETEIGLNQQKGMQTLFLVLDNDCYRPLGLESGSVKDSQITATNTRGYWEPHLARLNNQGKYNAWSTEQNHSWIQVDFQRPVVISQVATQGARQMFYTQFMVKYFISYSTDRRNWIFYKGNSRDFRKVFTGNQEAYETKRNTFFPPLIGRFVRLHPIDWYNKATVRMEFYGCELDGCSVPLGMESRLIEDDRIKASSIASSWYSGPWAPSLARLNKQGTINAWQAKYNDMNQWLQVELPQVKKITGIITQGAKALGKEMYVMSYSLQYSSNGIHWEEYTDDETYHSKTFLGNTNNNDHVKNYIYPPIFSRFIRIIPRSWMGSITMRIELLGCDFE